MSPVNRYQDILGVSRLHEVKLTTLGEVVKRNPLSALCSRIANAFRMRTQSGRAEIASRFEKIMAAMGEAATDALTGHVEPSRRQQAAVLETMGRLLKEMAQDDSSADDARKSVLNALKKDSAYAALSKEQKNALRDHLNDIVQGDPAHWQSDLMCLAANYRKSPAELKSLMHNTLMQEIDDALQTIIEQAEDPVQSETIAHKLDAADFYKALPEETDASKSRIKTALKDLYEKTAERHLMPINPWSRNFATLMRSCRHIWTLWASNYMPRRPRNGEAYIMMSSLKGRRSATKDLEYVSFDDRT